MSGACDARWKGAGGQATPNGTTRMKIMIMRTGQAIES